MKQLVLEKIVVSGFPPVNKRCLWLKGNTFYFWYKGAWRSVDSNIDIDEKYIDEKVNEVVVEKVIDNASEDFDTMSEIEQHFAEHKIESDARDVIIKSNTDEIEVLKEKIASGTGIPNVWEGFE